MFDVDPQLIVLSAVLAAVAVFVFLRRSGGGEGGTGGGGAAGGGGGGDFVRVAAVGDVARGATKDVSLGEGVGALLVHTSDDAWHAVGKSCTHASAALSKGVLAGNRLTCPLHGACWDVRTGEIEESPCVDSLPTFDVQLRGDDVLVRRPAPGTDTTRRPPKLATCNTTADKRCFVVIGAGAAGFVATQTLRAEGFQGRIVLVSGEKFLPYDRVKLSKSMAAEPQLLRDQAFYAKVGIEVLLGVAATALDPAAHSVTLSNGQTLRYDRVLIATGGDARRVPCEGADLRNIYALRVPEDAAGIEASAATAQRVVIIGSSFIGMEAAAYLKQAKKIERVVVVGMEKVPFERVLGEKIGEVMRDLHLSKGIEFRMQRTLKRYIGANGAVKAVELDDGEVIEADLVVIGAGIIPSTRFLASSGIPLERDGSIVCNENLCVTSCGGGDIFVAGDIARFPYLGNVIRIEHWNVAQQHGRVAARNMLGKNEPYHSVPFFWTMQFGVSVRYSGNAMSWDDIMVVGDLKARKFAAYFVQKDRVAACVTVGADPVAVAVAELLRLGKVPRPADLAAHELLWPQTLVA